MAKPRAAMPKAMNGWLLIENARFMAIGALFVGCMSGFIFLAGYDRIPISAIVSYDVLAGFVVFCGIGGILLTLSFLYSIIMKEARSG